MKSNISNEKLKNQFYTSKICVDFVLKTAFNFLDSKKIKISNKNIFIEPSAGKGEFINWLKKHNFKNVIGYDIDPKAKNIKKKDF